MELTRLRETGDAMVATQVRQVELAEKLAAAPDPATALPAWEEFVASVHAARHDAVRTVATLDRVSRLLTERGIKPESLTVSGSQMVADTNRWLASADMPAPLRERLAKRLEPTKTTLAFPDLGERLRSQLQTVDAWLLERVNAAGKVDDQAFEAFNSIGYLHDSSDERTIEIPCNTDEVVLAICVIIVVVVVINFILFFANEADSDEGPRRILGGASCETLRAMPDHDLIVAIEEMSDGPTLDGDEQAILRLFSCLPCDRVAGIWHSPSLLHISQPPIAERLLYDFDGAEWDQLMLRLKECGIVDFAAFDDDATRLFINTNDCAVLARLSYGDIAQLLTNMFSGDTHDADERAITRLIECLPLYRVAALLRIPGFGYDDFDDEVDGAEWRRLRARLDAARAIYG